MNETPQMQIETKNRSRAERKIQKSLLPPVIVCMCVLLAALIAFYVFLLIYNKYTFKYTPSEDGVSCTITSIEKRAIAPAVYFPSKLSVPESIDGLKVTAIGNNAAKGEEKLKKLSVPAGVVYIGEEAFASCNRLKTVTLPSGLAVIGAGAFKDCIALEKAEFGEGMDHIEKSAFEGCTKLAAVALPQSLISLGERAFYGCGGLSEIAFSASLASIGAEAFWACASLSEIELPQSLENIGEYAFWGCSELESASLGGAKTIGTSAFRLCTSLKSITLPESVAYMEAKTFAGCTSLETVRVPRGLRGIGERSFENCEKLTNITYGGTKAEWANLGLEVYWNINSSLASVTGTDGEITF